MIHSLRAATAALAALVVFTVGTSGPPAPPFSTARAAESDCPRTIRRTAREMARQLHDALDRHGFRFQISDLSGTLTVGGEQQRTIAFDVLREMGGTALALVDSELYHRTTLVAVSTRSGPVVTWLEWPRDDEIRSGAACEPTGSEIEYPDVPWPRIDATPLEWWGLRVLWRIPPTYGDDAGEVRSIATIVENLYAE